jgi:hypothetical protein
LAETVTAFVTTATNFPHRKILLVGASAALLAALTVPLLFRTDKPLAVADNTLKCYGTAGKYEPCVTQASASAPRFNGGTNKVRELASWTTTALYQPASLTTAVADQPANWTTNTPAAARHGITSGRHTAFAACRRRLIPCFFSTLRRGLTHIASVAATVAQGRPARERL